MSNKLGVVLGKQVVMTVYFWRHRETKQCSEKGAMHRKFQGRRTAAKNLFCLCLISSFKLNWFVSQCLPTTGTLLMSLFVPVCRKVRAICSHLGVYVDLHLIGLFNPGGEVFQIINSNYFRAVTSAGCTATIDEQHHSVGRMQRAHQGWVSFCLVCNVAWSTKD